MRTSPNLEPDDRGEDQSIAEALHNEKTITGFGRTQHGLNGKDADLDYGGQCVVKAIRIVDGTSKDKTMFIEIDILRYANICEPRYDEKRSKAENELLKEHAECIVMDATDYEGEWTGSDYWSFRHAETVRVPLTVDEHNDGATKENVATLAYRCVKAINAAPGKAFEQWAANLAKEISELSK